MFYMKKEFLLSVVIPTKDRQKYALHAVEQIMSFNDKRIEVVVHDNSTNNLLSNMIFKYASDSRLKYVYTNRILSFVDNFNLAINEANGKYVCVIGDDDGILPQIIEVVVWAEKNNIDAVKPGLNVEYFWPDSNPLINENEEEGILFITKITAKAKVCDSKESINKLMQQGGQNYLWLDTAKLYHGIVKKECLEMIKKKTGKYFGGLSPDIYIAVALSLTVKTVVKIDFPLTIPGVCSKSGSLLSVTGKHTGKFEETPHLIGHNNYQWSEFVPKFYSVETIWADSALAAIRDLENEELLSKFNINFLFADCLTKYPQFSSTIILRYKELRKKLITLKFYIFYNGIKKRIKFINTRIKRLLLKNKNHYDSKEGLIVKGVENILKAQVVINDRFVEIGIGSKDIINSLDASLKIKG